MGQGDAAVLRTPNGHFVVIDAGPGMTASTPVSRWFRCCSAGAPKPSTC
jgi:hypothetical protein